MKCAALLIAIAAVLVLSGCGITNPRDVNPEVERFYQGTEGVYMRFVPGSPPPRVFYYADAPSPADNEFDISVELHNMGSSDAMGALFISGYSPDIIQVDGVDIQKRGISDCIFDFNSFATGDFGFIFSCMNVDGGYSTYGDGRWNIRIREIGELLGIDALEGWDSIGIGNSGGNWNFNLGWDGWGSVDVLNHGRAMILMLASLDFRQYQGFPFNGGREKEGPGVLRGDNHYFPGGDFGFQDFTARVSQSWPMGLDEADVTFVVTSCYGYATYVAPNICIDPAPYDETEKVCTPREYTWSGSQGAPVAITNLKQDPAGKKIYLTFTIRNVGRGRVFNLGYLERCSPYFPGRLDSRALDAVYIGDIRIGTQRLDCSPGYEIRLNQGIGTFTCSYELEYATAKTAYETPVVAELWYGYQEQIQTRTIIKRVT